ncbi:MAG: hypothetical protein ACKVY0_13945 [Prosthecobacter sp.]|uniref:hypothetical protein n=1 Tax=Prosthecobacter sp. TaxID=1965333 RepID=UPI0038FECF37
MRTATALDLQTRLPTILAWLEAGEEVMVKPKIQQKEKTAVVMEKAETKQTMVYLDRSGKSVPATSEWQSKSAVFQRPLAPQPILSQGDLDELYDDLHGTY